MSEENPEYFYRTHGTCARVIRYDIDDDGKLHNVSFIGGCNGNLKGIGRLVEGADARWVADTLIGTQCGGRGTSCPDQLARSLREKLDKK